MSYSFEILTCRIIDDWILLHCLVYWFWFWHDCSDHFTCIHSPLYIIQLDMLILWLVYYFDRLWAWCLYHYSSWLSYSRLSCVYMSDIFCSVWLYDAWLPSLCMIACRLSRWVSLLSPISNSLGFGHSFHLGSHYCKCETFCVFALWPSQRLGVGSSDGLYRCTGAFWRRATLWCRLESDHWRPV